MRLTVKKNAKDGHFITSSDVTNLLVSSKPTSFGGNDIHEKMKKYAFHKVSSNFFSDIWDEFIINYIIPVKPNCF